LLVGKIGYPIGHLRPYDQRSGLQNVDEDAPTIHKQIQGGIGGRGEELETGNKGFGGADG